MNDVRPSDEPLRSKRRYLWLPILALVLGARAAYAQEMDAPVQVQIPLLLKILTFDRKLGDRAPGDDIVIAIVYLGGYRASIVARDEVVDVLTSIRNPYISGHPVHWVEVEYTTGASLRRDIIRERVDVIYLTPLRGVDLATITLVARTTRITSFTGVPHYVNGGVALGVGINRDRPEIIINLDAARAEGSDFNSQLLRVARIVEQ